VSIYYSKASNNYCKVRTEKAYVEYQKAEEICNIVSQMDSRKNLRKTRLKLDIAALKKAGVDRSRFKAL
jgi:hypothetical protein